MSKTDAELTRLNARYERLRQTLPEGVSDWAINGHVYGHDRGMYHHSGGRTFEQLCALIGQTAEVELFEAEYHDGFRERGVHWKERVIIREFQGSVQYLEWDWEIDDEVWVTHPSFEVETKYGRRYTMLAKDLKDIQPAG